jgi:hypothetical protein
MNHIKRQHKAIVDFVEVMPDGKLKLKNDIQKQVDSVLKKDSSVVQYVNKEGTKQLMSFMQNGLGHQYNYK